MALNIGDRLGHYDVTALIGKGGMGRGVGLRTPSGTGSKCVLRKRVFERFLVQQLRSSC